MDEENFKFSLPENRLECARDSLLGGVGLVAFGSISGKPYLRPVRGVHGGGASLRGKVPAPPRSLRLSISFILRHLVGGNDTGRTGG